MSKVYLSEATTSQPIEIFESADGKNKLTRFRAKVTTVDQLNQNGRVYRKAIFERELPKLVQESNRSDRIGAVDHPDKGNAPKVGDLAVRWTGFIFVGNDVIGEAEILPTAAGKVLEDLIRADVEIGFSSRGMGSATPGEFNGQNANLIDDDYELYTFDTVVQPSVAAARILAYEDMQRHAALLERFEAILKTNPDALEQLVEKVSAETALAEGDDPLNEFNEDEEGLTLEAKWTTKYKDSLPNSSFLYVKGDVRKFPYKDADGKVDLPHLRNALARIPDAKGLSDAEKAELTAKAQSILKAQGGDKDMKDDVTATEVAQTEATEEPAPATEVPVEQSPATPAVEESVQEPVAETTEVNPLQERVTSLEGELTEAQARATALEARAVAAESQVTTLNEDADSLTALLAALNVALRAELDDMDWDDTSLLAGFAQCVNWRRGCEASDAAIDKLPGGEDEAKTPEPTVTEKLADTLPAFIKGYQEAKLRAHIAKITRVERFGRAIASALEESAASISEADEMFPTVKELIQAKLNAIPAATTQGVVADSAPRWTAEQMEMRRLAGHGA